MKKYLFILLVGLAFIGCTDDDREPEAIGKVLFAQRANENTSIRAKILSMGEDINTGYQSLNSYTGFNTVYETPLNSGDSFAFIIEVVDYSDTFHLIFSEMEKVTVDVEVDFDYDTILINYEEYEYNYELPFVFVHQGSTLGFDLESINFDANVIII